MSTDIFAAAVAVELESTSEWGRAWAGRPPSVALHRAVPRHRHVRTYQPKHRAHRPERDRRAIAGRVWAALCSASTFVIHGHAPIVRRAGQL
jgi:hypothetical protein